MSSKKRIEKIRNLVDNLSDRDRQLKSDARLFEDFFHNFPIPVTMWSLDKDGNVISKRGNTVICENASCLENMFHEKYSEDFRKAHEKAYAGESVSFFSRLPEKTYYTRLVPRKNESQNVTGLTGISWDITSNFIILECLKQIKDLAEDKSEVKKLSEKALNCSRIKSLLEKI